MANELWDTLMKFHREVALPSIVTEIGGPLREEIRALDRKMEGRFDGVYQRLDRLETEYHALTASVKRLEARMAALESRMTGLETRMTGLETRMMALEQELAEVKTRLEAVENRLTAVDLLEIRRRISTLEEKIAEHEK